MLEISCQSYLSFTGWDTRNVKLWKFASKNWLLLPSYHVLDSVNLLGAVSTLHEQNVFGKKRQIPFCSSGPFSAVTILSLSPINSNGSWCTFRIHSRSAMVKLVSTLCSVIEVVYVFWLSVPQICYVCTIGDIKQWKFEICLAFLCEKHHLTTVVVFVKSFISGIGKPKCSFRLDKIKSSISRCWFP